MTGFGSAMRSIDGVEYAVEVRSVNNRYLKPVIKLPENWSAAEAQIEALLRQRIYRGTVTLAVRMKLPDEQAAWRVNTAALANYVEQLRVVEIDANPSLRIDLGSLLQLPGVCEAPPLEDICQRTLPGLMGLVEEAITRLIEMRDREGQGLRRELQAHCQTILAGVKGVSERAPQVVRDYQTRLTARVQELLRGGAISVDPDVLAREVAVFAERCDVAEEMSRLGSHVQQFLAAADAPEPAGRKMDFIAQEMLREANTIASKANDAEIAQIVVDLKTAIDRIKEQVQNVE